jgi:hypothetical protein
MNTQPEALRLADALDELDRQFSRNGLCGDAAAELRRLHEVNQDLLKALHEALETEQEPVAWITDGGKGELWWYQSSKFDEEGNLIGPNPDDIPLYTAPPKQWVGLTEEEREFLLHQALRFYDTNAQLLSFIKTVEEKLREKNA